MGFLRLAVCVAPHDSVAERGEKGASVWGWSKGKGVREVEVALRLPAAFWEWLVGRISQNMAGRSSREGG